MYNLLKCILVISLISCRSTESQFSINFKKLLNISGKLLFGDNSQELMMVKQFRIRAKQVKETNDVTYRAYKKKCMLLKEQFSKGSNLDFVILHTFFKIAKFYQSQNVSPRNFLNFAGTQNIGRKYGVNLSNLDMMVFGLKNKLLPIIQTYYAKGDQLYGLSLKKDIFADVFVGYNYFDISVTFINRFLQYLSRN